MNSQLLAVVQHIEAERGVSREIVLTAIEQALKQAASKNQEVTNYYVTDGLQGNEFTKAASHQDEYGDIYFGGINGILTSRRKKSFRRTRSGPYALPTSTSTTTLSEKAT
jgi:hypothetical protein